MTTLSPENSLSAKQSATFILVCSAICFEIGVHCAPPPRLALACDPQPSGCWAYIPDWHMFFSLKCLPPQPLVCTGTLCARSVGRLDVKGGAGPAGLWSRHQHQIQNRHLHSFLPCWEISEPKPAFLPRGVILKPVSFSELRRCWWVCFGAFANNFGRLPPGGSRASVTRSQAQLINNSLVPLSHGNFPCAIFQNHN